MTTMSLWSELNFKEVDSLLYKEETISLLNPHETQVVPNVIFLYNF